MGGLTESPTQGAPYEPTIQGKLTRAPIDRTNDFGQAGDTYRNFEDWERDELILNLVDTLKPAKAHIQQRMVWLFSQCDAGYGRRVAEGLGIPVPSSDPYSAPVPNESTGGGGLGLGQHEVAAAGQTAQPY